MLVIIVDRIPNLEVVDLFAGITPIRFSALRKISYLRWGKKKNDYS